MLTDTYRMQYYAPSGRETPGPLGNVYRLLGMPRLHLGGAESACNEIIRALNAEPSPENIAVARHAIRAFEETGWEMFSRPLILAVHEAETGGRNPSSTSRRGLPS
jgi:hypothetical protein